MSSTTDDKAIAKAPLNVGGRGISIADGDQLWRFATMVATAKGVQASNKDVAEIAIVMQAGLEMGLKPMEAMNNICVVKGRPCLWGDGIIAQLRRSGQVAEMKEWFEKDGKRLDAAGLAKGWDEGWVACFLLRLQGETEGHTERFSWAMVKRAGLAGKDTYRSNPEAMLRRRAISRCAKMRAAHCLAGLDVADEVESYTEVRKVESRPVDAPAAPDPLAGMLTESEKPATDKTFNEPAAPFVRSEANPNHVGVVPESDPENPPEEPLTPDPAREELVKVCRAHLQDLYPKPVHKKLLKIVITSLIPVGSSGSDGWQDWMSVDDLGRMARILKQMLANWKEKPIDEATLRSVIAESIAVVDSQEAT